MGGSKCAQEQRPCEGFCQATVLSALARFAARVVISQASEIAGAIVSAMSMAHLQAHIEFPRKVPNLCTHSSLCARTDAGAVTLTMPLAATAVASREGSAREGSERSKETGRDSVRAMEREQWGEEFRVVSHEGLCEQAIPRAVRSTNCGAQFAGCTRDDKLATAPDASQRTSHAHRRAHVLAKANTDIDAPGEPESRGQPPPPRTCRGEIPAILHTCPRSGLAR